MLCAGMDIEELYIPEKGRFKLQDIFGELYGSSYPTAAVINVSLQLFYRLSFESIDDCH